MSGSDGQGPRAVSVTLASAMEAYLLRTQALGSVEGQDGALALSPTLKPVVEALHHVLAGGEVEVRVARAGSPDVVQELDALAEQALSEANALLATEGGPLTATV